MKLEIRSGRPLPFRKRKISVRKIFLILFLCLYSSNCFAEISFLREQKLLNDLNKDASQGSEYPIILHHGFLGFRKILLLEYFYKVPEFLRQRGYEVFVTQVHPLASIERRAEELAQQIDEILKISGKQKVNIIAHSMGGLDGRYLIGKMGYQDKIASLSMISTPNQGSYLADIVASTLKGEEKVRKRLFGLMQVPDDPQSSLFSQAMEAVYNCSKNFIQDEFNAQVKDRAEVYYQSWAGVSTPSGGKRADILDPIFFVPYILIKIKHGSNDGVVSVDSAKWGHFRGTIPASHLHQVGFWFGLPSSGFNHKQFYKQVAQGLAMKGF